MGYYHVVNWATHHENSRSRQIRNITWVPVPNKHDGEGFLRIMEQPDGMIIYAAWHLILQVASKCHPRGTLVRDDGTPLTPVAIALKARASEADIVRAIEVLVSPEVNWLKEVTEIVDDDDDDDSGDGCQEGDGQVIPGCQEGDGCPSQKGREGKGTEGKETREGSSGDDHIQPTSPYPKSFEDWWAHYPRKVGKDKALPAWKRAGKRLKDSRDIASKQAAVVLLEAVQAYSKSPKGLGDFCPHPATWLNEGRYSDDRAEWNREGGSKSPPSEETPPI